MCLQNLGSLCALVQGHLRQEHRTTTSYKRLGCLLTMRPHPHRRATRKRSACGGLRCAGPARQSAAEARPLGPICRKPRSLKVGLQHGDDMKTARRMQLEMKWAFCCSWRENKHPTLGHGCMCAMVTRAVDRLRSVVRDIMLCCCLLPGAPVRLLVLYELDQPTDTIL